MDLTYNPTKIHKSANFSKERIESVLLLIVCLNSTLMLPFAIYLNYAILVTLLLFGSKLKLSDNVIPFSVLLFVIVFSALREVVSPNGTADSLHYFVSSFFWQIGYVALILFKKPSTEDLSTILLWSAFIQALLIILRLAGLFHFPVYGGLHESSAGLVSIHQREQITAVSISFSLWVWAVYGQLTFRNILLFLVSTFALLFTGSTGAFIAVLTILGFRLFLQKGSVKKWMIRILLMLITVATFSIVLVFVSEFITGLDLGEFDVLESTQMITDMASGGQWLAYKLFEANSRTEILQNYVTFSSNDTLSFLFGFDMNNWMDLNGELGSPHSFILEIFVHGGILLGLCACVFMIQIFIREFSIIKGLFYLFPFLVITIINSRNLAMPFLVIILMLFSRRLPENR